MCCLHAAAQALPLIVAEAAPAARPPHALEGPIDPLEDVEDDAGDDLRALINALVASSTNARECWEVQVTRPCFRSWRYLDIAMRRPVLRLLRLLVEGREARGAVNHAKPLAHSEPGLALFESYLPRGWRLLWEETFAYSELRGCWRDTILLCAGRDALGSLKGPPPARDRSAIKDASSLASAHMLMASEFGRRCGCSREAAAAAKEAVDGLESIIDNNEEFESPLLRSEALQHSAKAWIAYARALEDQGETMAAAALDAALEAQRRDPTDVEISNTVTRLAPARESALAPALAACGAPHMSNLHLLESMLLGQQNGKKILSQLVSGSLRFGKAGADMRKSAAASRDSMIELMGSGSLGDDPIKVVRRVTEAALIAAMLSLPGGQLANAEEWARHSVAQWDDMTNLDRTTENYQLIFQRRSAAWVCLAEVLDAQGRLAEAVGAARKGAERDPEGAVVRKCLRRLEEKAGDSVPADAGATPAALLQSGYLLDVEKMAYFQDVEEGRVDGELVSRTTMARTFGEHLRTRMGSGAWSYPECCEKYAEALELVRPAIRAQEERGGTVWARAYLVEAELALGGAIAHTAAGEAARGEQWAREAIAMWDRFDSRFPGEDMRRKPAAAWLALAEALQKQGRRPEALRAARAAEARDPFSVPVDDFVLRLEGRAPPPAPRDETAKRAALQAALERARASGERLGGEARAELAEEYAAEARALHLAVARAGLEGREGESLRQVAQECLALQALFARRAGEGALAGGRWKEAERFSWLATEAGENMPNLFTGTRKQLCEAHMQQALSFEGRSMFAFALAAATKAARADRGSAEAAAAVQRFALALQ
eukprot:tig00000984_g5981.t1